MRSLRDRVGPVPLTFVLLVAANVYLAASGRADGQLNAGILLAVVLTNLLLLISNLHPLIRSGAALSKAYAACAALNLLGLLFLKNVGVMAFLLGSVVSAAAVALSFSVRPKRE